MGSSSSTLQQVPEDAAAGSSSSPTLNVTESLERHHVMRRYKIEQPCHPGSGRMMRTYRIRHDNKRANNNNNNSNNNNTAGVVETEEESVAILKMCWVVINKESSGSSYNNNSGSNNNDDDESEDSLFRKMEQHRQELDRIKTAVKDQPHVGAYSAWFLGPEEAVGRTGSAAAALVTRGSATTANTVLRPIYLLRPHVYTTLSDRLASRPWLHHTEKLCIAMQILQALQALHDSNVVHGFLTTENIGLTSTGWVVLLDISSYKALPSMPDDDPSEYLYYFQLQHQTAVAASASAPIAASAASGTNGSESTTMDQQKVSRSEKRCYLAPERFYSPGMGEKAIGDSEAHKAALLTPAMDIFSTGCVLTELFLNGERCMDLGDLMDYRRAGGSVTAALQQKLNKIESSAIRAAIKHMLQLDPSARFKAAAYMDLLEAATPAVVPKQSFELLLPLVERITCSVLTPDARIAVAAAAFHSVLWECCGVKDNDSNDYFTKVLGTTSSGDFLKEAQTRKDSEPVSECDLKQNKEPVSGMVGVDDDDLFAQTEALLRRFDSLKFDDEVKIDETGVGADPATNATSNSIDPHLADDAVPAKRSYASKASLLIYLQLILSNMRHVQRPASKLVALQLIQQCARHIEGEARLQRIVPATVEILQDQDATVRAVAVQVLTYTLNTIENFAPSDSKVFPQYIFKRVSSLISDPSLVVRISFCKCVPVLAETAHRFLDISHAVRLYEAIGNDSVNTSSASNYTKKEEQLPNVFTDDVTKLLDSESSNSPFDSNDGGSTQADKDARAKQTAAKTSAATATESGSNDIMFVAKNTLISNTSYEAELAGLHETVSRWVVHICTDQAEHSSLPKRALLSELPRLSIFFGLEGVMTFILPQILAFLNDRCNWQLRAALFEHLPAVCRLVGRAATEEFVLPCVEAGLVDIQERVICSALECLNRLVDLGLLSRITLLGNLSSNPRKDSEVPRRSTGLLRKYCPLLVHPSGDIRHRALLTSVTMCQAVGSLDCQVYIAPILSPFFRFQPTWQRLYQENSNAGILEVCLCPAWTRERFTQELQRCVSSLEAAAGVSPTADGTWTSIGLRGEDCKTALPPALVEKEKSPKDPQVEYVQEYLVMLARHTWQQLSSSSGQGKMSSSTLENRHSLSSRRRLKNSIEGSVKLAQSMMFPRQNEIDHEINTSRKSDVALPLWYSSLRDFAQNENAVVSESAAIRSLPELGYVYGLSIMGPAKGGSNTENTIIGAAADEMNIKESLNGICSEEAHNVLSSEESKNIETAFIGEWGSETMLDPDVVDTTLLVTKLNALGVPPLAPKLGTQAMQPLQQQAGATDTSASFFPGWKPKINALVASSSLISGHTAPVVRLAISLDHSFFVSGSHDGTSRVWEIPQIDNSVGVLESSITYTGHSESQPVRINDVAMVEGSHSVVSGASDGTVHVWRINVSPTVKPSGNTLHRSFDRSRVVGASNVRKCDPCEGEVLAVSHFNSPSASVVTFGTQKGCVHSWDLRCAREPFALKHGPDLGYLTDLALGNDRHWVITSTSRGFIALWDIRFQKALKLWRHSREAPITRIATSFVTSPATWGSSPPSTSGGPRPYIFAACGSNECAMFDAITGACRECFRTVDGRRRHSNFAVDDLPLINEVKISLRNHNNALSAARWKPEANYVPPISSINCMVGSIGSNDSSYLITGGSDCRIRFWDFSAPSKCFVVAGHPQMMPRPSFERVDYEESRRLMLCRQTLTSEPQNSDKVPRKLFHGLKKHDHYHTDSIQDLKIIDNNALISCSRDCTVKVWR